MRRILLLLVLAAIAAAGDAPQVSEATRAFLAKVTDGARNVATVHMPFTQEKHLAIMDEPIVSPGLLEISKPQGAVRWEFTSKTLMIFAHGKARRWGAEGKEETIPNDPNMKSFQDQMQAFLSGDWSGLEKAFDLTPDPAGKPILTMTPHSDQVRKYIDHITLVFRDDFTAPREMRLAATGGDETVYRFGDPQVNADIPAARFAGP
jgi:hypothetical protein